MTSRTLSLAIALALAPTAAFADTAATDLDTVLVTGTRTEVPLAESIDPAQVIDRAEIERLQVRSLPDLLNGQAGIQIGNSGGPGKLSSIFLRGSESDHVLVLVDGVRIGTATAGLASIQDIPVDQIERIEIVRGPHSSLYGSEAIGGVIQIFTRRDVDGITPRARIGAGSHGLREGSAGIGGRVGRSWFGVDAAYQRTDGIDACRGNGVTFQGCFVDEPDRDGYRNRSLNLRGGIALSDSVTFEANALRAEGFNEYDGSIFGGNEADTVQQVVGTKLVYSVTDVVRLTAQAGRADDRSTTGFRSPDGTRVGVGRFDTRRDQAAVQADMILAPTQQVTLGFDWQQDRVDSATNYLVTDRDNLAVFAAYIGRFGANRLQASVRRDENQQFGDHTTGSVGWGLDLSRGLRLNASVGTAFKAPTFNDLYFPGSESPDLQPERSRSVNVGVSQTLDGWRWGVNAFETRVDDLIVFVYPPPFYIGVGENVDEARIRGAELTFGTTFAGWNVATALSHVDPRDRSGGFHDGNLLARRARNTGRIDVDRAFGDFGVGTTVRGAGSRFDDPGNNTRVAGYGTVDLRASWTFARDWTLEARATNLLDKDYETVAWYYQPGREYGLALRWQPGATR